MIFKKRQNFEVCTYGAEVLSKSSRKIEQITPEVIELAEYMLHTMNIFNGIGIAAPQVGVNLRLVVIDISPDAMEVPPTPGELELFPLMPLVQVNPEITAVSSECSEREEGCLSVPEIYAPVTRPVKATLKSTLLNGRTVEVECGGLLGRCIQHELDHLDGKVFVDRLTPANRKAIEQKLKRLQSYYRKRDNKRLIKM